MAVFPEKFVQMKFIFILLPFLLLLIVPVSSAQVSQEIELEWHYDESLVCWFGLDNEGQRWSILPKVGELVIVEQSRTSIIQGEIVEVDAWCGGNSIQVSNSSMLEEVDQNLGSDFQKDYFPLFRILSTVVISLLAIVIMVRASRDENIHFNVGKVFSSISNGSSTEQTVEGAYQRGRIMGFLTTNQGAHLSAITRSLGFGNNQASHHLSVLLKDGMIFKKKDHRFLRFYTSDVIHSDKNQLPIPLPVLDGNGIAMQLLMRIKESKTTTLPNQRQLARELSTSQQLVSYHLKSLEVHGFITRKRKGLGHKIGLTAEGESILHDMKYSLDKDLDPKPTYNILPSAEL
ncbi:MAG: MarR family transcriptional regulator [Candidatus Poseidoniia archaeon]|jgi:predicted transcriptional regulator|nr:MAG: hypothetical protein CXT68_08145 [Euryarchaeota archaeon]